MADNTNGYGVRPSAVAWDVTAFVNVVSAYRMGQDSSAALTNPTDSPPYLVNGCDFILHNPDFVRSGAPSGTASASDNLTASSSSASLQPTRPSLSLAFDRDVSLNLARSDIRLGSAFARATLGTQVVNSPAQDGWATGGWAFGSPTLSVFTGNHALVGATPTLGLWTDLSTDAGWASGSSHDNTATFQMRLPAGVGYSSSSGVLLGAVPEPGTDAMLLAGLGTVGVMARRRSRTVA